MTVVNPDQTITDEINSLQSRISDLQESVRLTKVRDALEDLQSNVNGMSARLTTLRTRGYVFEKDLESQVKAITDAWALLSPNVQSQMEQQASLLMSSLRPIELQMPQLAAAAANPTIASGLLRTLQTAVGQVESGVSAAENAIDGMYNQFGSQVNTLSKHLDEINYLLTQLSEASFQLLPTEAGIAAVKAVWCKTGKEQKGDPAGILYLTDQRLLFEEKEEVATRKVLFITTEKEKKQGLQLEAPVVLVEKVETSKQGLLKNEDHVEVHFSSGAPITTADFHIWQENTIWQTLINRARSKDFDTGRAVAIDQAAVARAKAAPSQCPNCGGIINRVVLRGQDNLTCEYCGFVIRL